MNDQFTNDHCTNDQCTNDLATEELDSTRLERLRWRSRRGLLELELLLAPFVNQRIPELSSPAVDQYERMLDHDDMDVHEWLMQRREPPADMRAIVAEIREFLTLDRF